MTRQVDTARASEEAGFLGVFFVGPNGELTIGRSMPEGFVSRFLTLELGPPPFEV